MKKQNLLFITVAFLLVNFCMANQCPDSMTVRAYDGHRMVWQRAVPLRGPQGMSDIWVFEQAGKLGIADKNGRIITPTYYDDIYPNPDNMPFVYKRDSLFGYIDIRTGQEITPPMFKLAGTFHENRAIISIDGKKMGYIDTTGQIVISPHWDLVSDFYQGIAKVVQAADLTALAVFEIPHNVQIPTPGKTALIDRNGNYIVPPDYSYIDINSDQPYLRFTRGLYNSEESSNPDFRKVYPKGKWGLMDLKGCIILSDTEYDYIFPLWKNGICYYGVEKDGRYGVLAPQTLTLIVPLGNASSDDDLLARIID